MAPDQIKPSLKPLGDIPSLAGYAVPAATSDSTKAAAAARKYLNDPLALSRLTDRVYELLLEDLRSQRERVRNYGQQRWL